MDNDFDELGNYLGSQEYSDSEASEHDGWEDVTDPDEDNALVKSLYGPNVEVAHYKHDTQDVRQPLLAPESHLAIPRTKPLNWEFHKALLDSAPTLVRSIGVEGHVNHGKSSFVEMFTGKGTTDLSALERQRKLTLSLSCHTSLVQNSHGKSFVLNIVDTPGHTDFDEEVQASRILAGNRVLVVDAVEGPVLSRPGSPDVVIVSKLDRLILDLRIPPHKAFDRLRFLIEEELSVDPERVVFMSSKFHFAFTLQSFSNLYASFQNSDEPLPLWNSTNFTSYVLDPLYKLFSYGLIGSQSQAALLSIGISLSDAEWRLDFNDRISLILGRFFEDPGFTAVVDALIKYTRPWQDQGHTNTQITVVKKVRLGSGIFALAQVHFGTLESSAEQQLYVPYGFSVVETDAVHAGNWVLLSTAESPTALATRPLVKVGIEPLRDSALISHQVTTGLETLCELRPAMKMRAMETGEHYIWGTGELYMDSIIDELRSLLGVDLHVGPPSAELMETVIEQSYAACPTKTSNLESSVTVLALPINLDSKQRLYQSKDPESLTLQQVEAMLQNESIWSVYKGNVLSDNCNPPLLQSVDKSVKDAIIQGFEWACNEGPLIEEQLTGIHFQIIEGQFDGTIQLLPTMRRACHAAMLVASPRLMEPWMSATIIGPLTAGKAVYSQLAKRRGRVEADQAVIGTNLYVTKCIIPLMDAFGFEVDVLCNVPKRDGAQVNLELHDWRVVDGDPLDNTVAVPRMKPALGPDLARDYMLKTRRRKGLVPQVSLERYLDEDVAQMLFSS